MLSLLFLFFSLPDVYAQSEEDILNSIEAELNAEEDAKSAEEAKKKQYEALKSKAEGYFKAGKYDKAKPLYTQMSEVMPDNDYPKRQLRLIDQKIEEQKEAELQAKYDKLIQEADALMGKESWDAAKAKYDAAAQLKTDESYPKTQAKKIVELKAAKEKAEREARIQAKYDEYIAAGDAALAKKQFDEARTAYQNASKTKSDETYPTQQLAAVDKAEKEEKARVAELKAQKQYDDAIAAADGALKNEQWEQAKAKYQEASKLKPNESYPKTQLAQVDKLKADAADRAKQAELKKQYDGIIAQADNLFKSKQWDDAIAKYQEALGVLNDPYPTEKINAAKQAKADEANAAEQARIDAEYKQVIDAADQLFKAGSYAEAIPKYKEAQGIKSGESYPGNQIGKAEQAIADAKAAEEKAAKQAEYDALIQEADGLMQSQNWKGAIPKYEQAKALGVDKGYAAGQITKAQQAIAEADKAAAAAAELEANFSKAMSDGQSAVSSKNWEGAVTAFETAVGLKPDDPRAKDQLKAAKEGLAQAQAEVAKQAAEAEAQAALEAKYQDAISKADAAFSSKQYDKAVSLYQQAQEIKPEQTYPATQLTAIEKAKADQAAAEAQAAADAAQAEINAKYQDAISKADAAFSSKQFDKAIGLYQQAQEIKPEETYPASQLTAIETAKADQAAAEEQAAAAAAQAELDADYNEAVQKADAAFNNKDYTTATALYQQALGLKPNESHPTNQLSAIEAAIADAAAAEAAAAQAEAEKEAQFATAMENGQAALDSEGYADAVTAFETALQLKSDDKQARKLLGKAQAELQKQQAAQAAAEAEEAAKAEAEAKYAMLIQQADAAFSEGDFILAKQGYEAALDMKISDDEYPSNQLALLAEKEEELKAQKEALENQYSALMSQGEEALRNKDWDAARSAFGEASALKPEAMGAKERIEEVNRLENLAREEAEKAAEAERLAAEKQSEFDATMTMGNEAVTAEQWEQAVGHFQKALELFPSDPNARDQLRLAQDQLNAQREAEAAARAEAERIAAEEAARKRAEEEAKRKAEEEARRRAEEAAARAAALQQQFNNAVSAGDAAMSEGDFKTAVEQYGLAVELKPEEAGVGSKLMDAEEKWEEKRAAIALQRRKEEAARRMREEEERRKRAELAEKRRQERIRRLEENSPTGLAKRYPNGITEEVVDQGYRVIKKTIIVEDGLGRQLFEIVYPWGLKLHYLNGKRITSDTYRHDIARSRDK